MSVQVRTVKAFVEGHVFAEAVAACEKAQSSTPFKWNGGTNTSIVGLNSVKLDKYTVIASYTLVADGVYCDYDPIKKKADIGSNFLERDRSFGPMTYASTCATTLRSPPAIVATPHRFRATSRRRGSRAPLPRSRRRTRRTVGAACRRRRVTTTSHSIMRKCPVRSPAKSRMASMVSASIEPLTSSLPSASEHRLALPDGRETVADRPAASNPRNARRQARNCVRSDRVIFMYSLHEAMRRSVRRLRHTCRYSLSGR